MLCRVVLCRVVVLSLSSCLLLVASLRHSTMPNINWRNSAARKVILQDLKEGGRLYGRDDAPAKTVWLEYCGTPEFAGVPYKQFVDRLRDHRKQVTKTLLSLIAGRTCLPEQSFWRIYDRADCSTGLTTCLQTLSGIRFTRMRQGLKTYS